MDHSPPTLVRVLLAFYFPVLLSLTAGLVASAVFLALQSSYLIPVSIVLGVWPVGHALLMVLPYLRKRGGKDWMEMRLPRKRLAGLYELVHDVARRWRLHAPQEIRLGADTVAHVYEDEEGKEVLVIGGVAVAAFPQDVLAGIVAHELAHFTAGDTRLSRRAMRTGTTIYALGWYFRTHPSSWGNPLVWFLALYHLAFHLAWARNSREQEYAADQYSVDQVGKDTAGAALVFLEVTGHLRWAQLSSMVEAFVATNEPMSQLFAEQVRRVRLTSKSDWEDAFRRAMRRGTGLFDSHPALKDRLKALGVSPRKAARQALELHGPPASDLIADWERVEKELSDRLIAPYREYYLAKMEMAQIILGRPVR